MFGAGSYGLTSFSAMSGGADSHSYPLSAFCYYPFSEFILPRLISSTIISKLRGMKRVWSDSLGLSLTKFSSLSSMERFLVFYSWFASSNSRSDAGSD